MASSSVVEEDRLGVLTLAVSMAGVRVGLQAEVFAPQSKIERVSPEFEWTEKPHPEFGDS